MAQKECDENLPVSSDWFLKNHSWILKLKPLRLLGVALDEWSKGLIKKINDNHKIPCLPCVILSFVRYAFGWL